MAAESIPYIQTDARGVPFIAGTRIKVRQIAQETEEGYTPEDIQAAHPHLSLAQIHAALAYYHARQETIDADIERTDLYAEQMQESATGQVTRQELEERLKRRQAGAIV